MDRQLPYQLSYKTLKSWRKVETIFLWSTFICSILSTLFQIHKNECCIINCLSSLINFINYISIIGYGLLYIIVEIIMQPMIAKERRKGFIDNSLGTNLLGKPVINYYDNDSLDLGMYKLLVNCFENCHFTYHIIRKMMMFVIFKNLSLCILLIVFAYWGIKSNILSIPILQLFISSLFLFELAYHISFYIKLKHLYEQFQSIFNKRLTKKESENQAVYMVLEYETALAYNKSPNSDSVYQKMREQLTDEWNELKKTYNIQ